MSKSTLTRRALVASTAAMPAAATLGLPSSALADPTNADAELLKLGADLKRIGKEWLAQRAIDRSDNALWEARCEAAGLPYIKPPAVTVPHKDWEKWRAYQDKRCALFQFSGDPNKEDEVWDDINDRMWDIIDEVFKHRPQTLAGFAVQAHAVVLSQSEWWNNSDDFSDERRVRSFLENFCAFTGIAPEPIQDARIARVS